MDTERVKVGDVEYHTRAPRYYRCSNCMHERNQKCEAKAGNPVVKLNKKRNHCKKFKIDEEKLAAAEMKRNPIPIERRPDWFWMTRNQKKRLAELLQGAAVAPESNFLHKSSVIAPPDSENLIWTPGDAIDDKA